MSPLFKRKTTATQRAKVERSAPGGVTAAQRNVLVTRTGTWAWFGLEPEAWHWLNVDLRGGLLNDGAARLAELVGRRIHVLSLPQSFPHHEWGQGMWEHRGKDVHGSQFPDVEGTRSYDENVVAAQEHMISLDLVEPYNYIGVRLTKRRLSRSNLRHLFAGDLPSRSLDEVRKTLNDVTKVFTRPGMRATPLSPMGLLWVLHATQAPGLPVEHLERDEVNQTWGGADPDALRDTLEAVYDTNHITADPYGAHFRVRGNRFGREINRYGAALSVGVLSRFDDEDPNAVPWMAWSNDQPETILWSAIWDVKSGEELQQDAYLRRRRAEVQVKHYEQRGERPPEEVREQIDDALVVEKEVRSRDANVSTRLHGRARMYVIAESPDDLADQVTRVIQAARSEIGLRLTHTNNQHEIALELRPGHGFASAGGHHREAGVAHASTAMPNVSSSLGDGVGPFLGPLVHGGRGAVCFDPNLGQANNVSGLTAIVADPGGGKTTLAMCIAADMREENRQVIVNDPSGATARLLTHPRYGFDAEHIELSSAAPGRLNAYRMVPVPHRSLYDTDDEHQLAIAEHTGERMQSAIDTFLGFLPKTLAIKDGVDSLVEAAVADVGGAFGTSPWDVVRKLELIKATALSKQVAKALRSSAELPGARSVFPNEKAEGDDSPIESMDAGLVILTMRGLTIPQGEPRNRQERIVGPLLQLAARYGARAMYANREPKGIITDEGGIIAGKGSSFAPFLLRGARDSRKSNTFFALLTQNPADVLAIDPEISNLMGAMFAGRIRSTEVAKAALRLMGLPDDSGRDAVLRNMQPGHWLMRDANHVRPQYGLFRHDISWKDPELVKVLDTTPPGRRERPRAAHFETPADTVLVPA